MHMPTCCLLLLTALTVGPLCAQTATETETVGTVTWTYTVNADDGGVTVTGAAPASGRLTIPDMLGGRPVTVIGDRCFRAETDITQVTLPKTIVAIGNSAFYQVPLTEIDLPDALASIGTWAFGETRLSAVVLPNGITTLSDSAFRGIRPLKSAFIPSSVEVIGPRCFEDCTGLISVAFPSDSKLGSIEEEAFQGCNGLPAIDLPATVASIGSNAFNGCTTLSSIIIPDAVSTIPRGLFSGCESLKTTVLPKNLKTIYTYANNDEYHPFCGTQLEALIFRSAGIPELQRSQSNHYISPHDSGKTAITCYTDNTTDDWAGVLGASAGWYTLKNLKYTDDITGEEMLAIINRNSTLSSISIEGPGASAAGRQPVTEAAMDCFSGVTSRNSSTVSVTPYAFGISGLTLNVNGDPVLTVKVTGISGNTTQDDRVCFADGTEIVVMHHTKDAAGKPIREEVTRKTIDSTLSGKDSVDIVLTGFLKNGGKGEAIGSHPLSIYAIPPAADTAAE